MGASDSSDSDSLTFYSSESLSFISHSHFFCLPYCVSMFKLCEVFASARRTFIVKDFQQTTCFSTVCELRRLAFFLAFPLADSGIGKKDESVRVKRERTSLFFLLSPPDAQESSVLSISSLSLHFPSRSVSLFRPIPGGFSELFHFAFIFFFFYFCVSHT